MKPNPTFPVIAIAVPHSKNVFFRVLDEIADLRDLTASTDASWEHVDHADLEFYGFDVEAFPKVEEIARAHGSVVVTLEGGIMRCYPPHEAPSEFDVLWDAWSEDFHLTSWHEGYREAVAWCRSYPNYYHQWVQVKRLGDEILESDPDLEPTDASEEASACS